MTGAALLAGCFFTINAQEAIEEILPQKPLVAQEAEASYAPDGIATMPQTIPMRKAPANIVGKRFMTFFDGFSNYGKCANWFEIEQAAGDSLLLKGVADGFNLTAKYDPATGQLTIPTGKVIGQNSDGIDIVIYNLLASEKYASYNSTPVVATVSEDKIIFADGFLGRTNTNLNYVRMTNIYCLPPNGTVKFSVVDGTTWEKKADYEYPIRAEKMATDQVQVRGLATWLYHHDYWVPFTITESSNTAKIYSYTDTVDTRIASGLKESYFMYYRENETTTGSKINPVFNIVNGDTTTMTAANILFEARIYLLKYYGWYLSPYKITFDFNLYDEPVAYVDTIDGLHIQRRYATGTAAVIGAAPTTTEVVIPASTTYEGTTFPITTIATNAFSGNTAITKLTIPSTIKSIEASAFKSMTNLAEVHMPDLKSWCAIEKASSYSVPYTNSKFSSTTKSQVYFEGIEGANPEELTIPDGVSDINYAFYSARFLKKAILGKDVKTAMYAFYNCSALTDVELNEGLELIENCFYNCSFTTLDIPRSIKNLNLYTLYNCRKLTNLILHTGLEKIYGYSIYNCTALTDLVLPSSLISISANAFRGTTGITSLTCRAATPPTCAADDVFSPFQANATLKVPTESIAAYKAAQGWKNFTQINGDETAVEAIDDDTTGAPAKYFTIQGVAVDEQNLAPGLYIKVRNGKATKIIVK